MFQFGLYRVLIIQLGVLLGFYKFNVHKYNFGNLTMSKQSSCAHPLRSLAPPKGGPGPQVGNHCFKHSYAPGSDSLSVWGGL